MEVRYIKENEALALINKDESHFWDFKSARSDGKVVQKIAVALANAEGGEFIVGVEDVKEATGLARWKGFVAQEDANWVHTSLVKDVSPPIPYDIEFLKVEGREDLRIACLVSIQKSPDVHKTSSQAVFQRRGAQSLELKGTAIADLTLSKGAKSYEDQVLDDYDLDEVSEEDELAFFLESYTPSSTPEKFLSRQRLIDRKTKKGTVASAILFAAEPAAVVPKRCSVKIARYETAERIPQRKYLKGTPATVDGCARELIDRTLGEVRAILQEHMVMQPDGSLSPMRYPPEALKEIIVNAVIHRDYNISDDILISIYDNRVEVRSPGRLPGHITRDNILEDRFARNPTIVRLLNKYPDAPNKDIGEGLDTVFNAMKAARLKAPQLRVDDNSFVVILEHAPLARPEEIVLEYLGNHPEITNRVARALTGIESENAMKKVFYKLRDGGQIELVPGRTVYSAAWRLVGE
ncbi:ATP-binding protein [Nonomuraea insulae]|uniref:ATP-binding protein n=1 Tax=Nonomuraea insulae TaxID=1616787 RepID=A0ABW1CT61_9ACTN